MPWKNKSATIDRNARWVRIVTFLPRNPRLLIVDAECFGTLHAMLDSPQLRHRHLDITIVNYNTLPDVPPLPSRWTVRVLRANFYDLGLFKGIWNAIYADLCGVGKHLVQAIRKSLDETHPCAYMATICSGRGQQGWTLAKRLSMAQAAAHARLSVRHEKKQNRSATMCTLEGHNAAFRALYRGRVCVHTWDETVDIISAPIRPRRHFPWMICVRDSCGKIWKLELTDTYAV